MHTLSGERETAKKHWIFLAGLSVTLILYLPILLLNIDMRAIIHDEFDAEILTYVLNARHPAEQFLPELFNGTTVSSMTPPAPLLVLLYHALNPQAAFFVGYLLIIVISYTGMFLCMDKAVHDSAISAFTAVCFALLPFYPV